MSESLRKSTAAYLAIAILGLLVGYFIMSVCQDGSCAAVQGSAVSLNKTMTESPLYVVWITFNVFQIALCFLLAPILWNSFGQFRPYLTKRRMIDLALSTLLLLILSLIPNMLISRISGAETFLPIYLIELRFQIEVVIIFLCIAPALNGIWLIRDVLETKYARIKNEQDPSWLTEFILLHIQLRDLSQRYLLAVGLEVTLLTLATGANRDLKLAIGGVADRFPIQTVLIYALYYSVLLALIYIPTYLSLLNTGYAVRDELYPICDVDKFNDQIAKRKSFEENLQLNINFEQNLRAGLVILSPLLSGILTTLIGK